MGIFTGILVYVIVWWLVFFMALPFGVQPEIEGTEGHQRGAPLNPRLWLKAGVTTIVTTFIFYLLYIFVPADMLEWAVFRDKGG